MKSDTELIIELDEANLNRLERNVKELKLKKKSIDEDIKFFKKRMSNMSILLKRQKKKLKVVKFGFEVPNVFNLKSQKVKSSSRRRR